MCSRHWGCSPSSPCPNPPKEVVQVQGLHLPEGGTSASPSWISSHLWLRMYVIMVEKRQSNSKAVQGYTTGCNPGPEPPASRGNALSSWERGSERAQPSVSVPKPVSLSLTPASLDPMSECFSSFGRWNISVKSWP